MSLALALLLGGCGGEAPAEQGEGTETATQADTDATPVSGPELRVLAFGDSLFAGYNLAEGEGYPAVLEAELRERGINARVTDAGVSGDTTQAGRQRIGFALDNMGAPPDLAIVELGGNDLLRGIPPEQTRENLAAILAELEERGIPVLLMGMRAPPNLGADFVSQFDAIYPALAERYNAELVPFFLEAVYDRPELIQPDRIHPTAEGVEALVAATADEVETALLDRDGSAETATGEGG
jgi:acyl-CoA thioesterase-1